MALNLLECKQEDDEEEFTEDHSTCMSSMDDVSVMVDDINKLHEY